MILVFAGAGASKAVSPDSYPTTVEFYDRLPKSITSDVLFQLATDFLREQLKVSGSLDIEQVLWLMKDLRDFTSRAVDPGTVLGWFVQRNRLSMLASETHPQDIQSIYSVAQGATTKISALTSEINQRVYDFYGDPPSEDQIENNWGSLITGLIATSQPLELVTTNYDVVIEEAIELLKVPILTGRTKRTLPTLDESTWDISAMTTPPPRGRLTKLHGSVDFVRVRNRIHVGTPSYQGQHERHAIIYPGFKGAPTDPFFQKIHQYLQYVLTKAKIAIFIGYSFRDEYINEILTRNLSDRTQIIVLDPKDKLPDIPFPKNRFQKPSPGYFDQQGVNEILRLVQKSKALV